MAKPAILIVEDDAILTMHLQDLLTRQGYEIAAAVSSGEAALQTAQRKKPSLILMDVELNGEMNGIQAAKEFSTKTDIPVIFLTSYSQDSLLQQAKIAAPYGYLVKPVQEREMIATIEMALYRHKLDLQLKQNELRYRSLIEQASDGIFLVDPDGNFIEANSCLSNMSGFTREKIFTKKLQEIIVPQDLITNPNNFNILKVGESILSECQLIHKNGTRYYVEINTKKLEDGNLQGVVRNINQRKKDEQKKELTLNRLKILHKITQYEARDIQDLLDFSLSSAIKLTESEIGYIYFYDETLKQFTLNSWSKNVMKECEIAEPQTIYKLDKTGLWGETVRQRKAIIDNDFQIASPLKKGYPHGHVELKKFLTIPVINDNQIVAVVGVANKKLDYDETDILQLSLLMDSVWKIVQRKRFEEELLESAQKYNTIINTSLDGFAIIDQNGIFQDVNETYCQMSGYSKNELLNFSLKDIESAETSYNIEEHIQNVLQTGQDRFETRQHCKNGQIIDVEISTTFLSESGNLLSFFQNITEKKRFQSLLQESEEKYRLLVEHSSDLIWKIDPEGVFNYLSPSWIKVTGLKPENLQNTPFQSLVHPDDLSGYLKYIKELSCSRKSLLELEYRIRHADDTWRWHAASAAPVIGRDGNVLSFVGVSRDVTAQKEANKALKQKTEELDRYFTSSLDLLCITDHEGHFLRLNPEWEKTLGYPLQELTGANFLDYVHPEDIESTLVFMARLNNQEPVLSFINRYRCKDGSHKWIEWRSKAQGNLIYAAARDISTQKEIENELLQIQDRFNRVMDATNDGIYDANMVNGGRYFSPSYYRMLGYEPGEFEETEEAWANMIHPEDRDYILQLNKDYFNNLIPKLEGEYRMRKKNGEWVWILGRAKAVEKDANGKTIRVVGTHIDITERKKYQEARREVEEKFTKIFHISPDAIAIIRFKDAMFMDINAGFTNICGYTAEEIIGKTLFEINTLADEENYKTIKQNLIEKGEINNFEIQLFIKTERSITALLSAKMMRINNEDFILSIFRDISHLKQAAKKQEEQIKELLRWQNLTLGRENRILDLKKEVNDLLTKNGLPTRYQSAREEKDL